MPVMDQGPVLHVLGARPNFVKSAPVVNALRAAGIDQAVVHTGQHYDALMSDAFFADLGLPEPIANLGVGSGSHAAQTAAVMVGFEKLVKELPPSLVIVYGDVNSTAATALVCAKAQLPFAHVEAGLRSFDRTMPEEINRVVTDALADLLFVTSPEAVGHLGQEGVDPAKTYFVGNPMIDSLFAVIDRLDPAPLMDLLRLRTPYAVATVHRPSNVDSPEAVGTLVGALNDASKSIPIVLPLHPRGRDRLLHTGLGATGNVSITDPLGYLDFLSLVRGSSLVITDSGGVQEETTMLRIPCLTLRPNTERPVTVTHGTNRLVSPDALPAAVEKLLADGAEPPLGHLPPLWDGKAGERIASVIAIWLSGSLPAPRASWEASSIRP